MRFVYSTVSGLGRRFFFPAGKRLWLSSEAGNSPSAITIANITTEYHSNISFLILDGNLLNAK